MLKYKMTDLALVPPFLAGWQRRFTHDQKLEFRKLEAEMGKIIIC